MAIQISVPGFGVAEFPDGVSYDQAFSSIQEAIPDWQPSRSDVFAKLRSNSEAMAATDNARFLDQQGDSDAQIAYEKLAGNVTRGAADLATPFVRVLERPMDEFYKMQNKSVRRLGGTAPERFESGFREPMDEAADAAEIVTRDRGNSLLNFGADVVGGIAPNVAAQFLMPGISGVGVAASAVQQAGSSRKRVLDYYKELGLPEEDAQNTADMQGLVSGAATGLVTKYTPKVLGKIPGVGKYVGGEGVEGVATAILAKQLSQTTIGEIAKRAVGTAAGEATEEGINQFLLEVIESKRLEPNLSWEEIAKRTAYATALGGAGGAGVSAVVDAGRAGINKATVYVPPTDFEILAREGRFENAKKELDKTREARNQIDQARESSANELAAMVGIEAPHVEPIQAPAKLAQPVQQPLPQVAPPPIPQQAPTAPAPAVDDRMVRAIGVKSLIARGVDPDVAVSFVNTVAPSISATTTEEARGLINSAFDDAGLLDAGANTFSTEVNIRNAQEAEGWNETDVQNMLHNRRTRAKEISDHNRSVINQFTGAQPTATPAVVPESLISPQPQAGVSIEEAQQVPQVAADVQPQISQPSIQPELGAGAASPQVSPGPEINAPAGTFKSKIEWAVKNGKIEGLWASVRSNRPMVVVNINGVRLPFYRSLLGTGGHKKAGEWQPFFGLGDNAWVIKGTKEEGVNDYGSEDITKAKKWLNENFNWPHELDKNLRWNQHLSPLHSAFGNMRPMGEVLTGIFGFAENEKFKQNGDGDSQEHIAQFVNKIKQGKQTETSTADKIYKKLDEWDKGLGQGKLFSGITGFEPVFIIPIAKLILKTAKLAIRAGQSVSDAIKTAIAKARVDFPDAKFNDEALRKEMLSELQGFITGDEQSQAIAQAAQPVVARNESAAAQLDTSRYNNEGYKTANRTLQDLRDRAIQAALAFDQPASVVPTNVMSDEFAEAAETLGLDSDQIKELQAAINFEDRAKELASLITQRDSYTASQSSLSKASGSKYKDTIKFFQDAVAKVSKKIAAPKYADVQSRASEILSLRANRVDLEAKKRSLQNENVRNALVGPVGELRNLMEENPEMLDKGVQDFIEDPTVDDEIKQVVIIRMSNLFMKFDMYQQNVEDLLTSRQASLERTIAKLTGQLREKEMEKAYADIVTDDARRALSGESVVGGLNPDWLEWFDKNQSAVRSFARMLSKRVGESDPQALAMLDWITSNPEGAPPAIRNIGTESNWGVGDDALNSIIDTLKQSPPIRQAVAAIYEGGSETLPAHELREIATAALGGDKDYANQLYDSLVKRTQNERRKLAARVNTLRKELEEARIEIGALQEASKMFTEVAESPVFKDARMAVESSGDSFQKQFLISKNDGLALKGFKIPGAEGQNEVSVAASESGEIDFTQKKAAEIKQWYDNASAYVSAYEMVLNDYSMDQSNKTPLEEGFDPAVYRGLKVALATEVPILLDPVNFNPDLGLSQNTPVNLMLNSADWFRQLDSNAKLVEGIFGSNYKAKIASYRNTRLALDRAMNDVRFKQMPSLLSAAMASHPSVGGKNWLDRLMNKSKIVSGFTGSSGNMEMYRKLVFNPMAHEGRMFGGNLRVGMTLPTGEVVTEADMELLKRSMDFSKELLKIAQSESKGTEVEVGGKVYRRKAGSVGDYGTPRHINQDGVEAMKRIATAYSKNNPDQKFDAQNLDTHPIAELWNTLANQYNALTHHVLDSAYRTDRDISVTPLMRQAYRALAGELEDANFSNKIASIQDLVARLRFHFPDGSGYDSRQYVIEQLNVELGQYAANSRSQTDARAKSEDEKLRDIAEGKESNRAKSASMIETETSNNEFTKPAGKLIIPSVFYDYSSITPVEMKLASSRAVGERVVDLKTSMRVASDSVQAMIIRANSTPDDPGVKSMLSKIAPDQSQAVSVLEKIRDSLNSLDDDIGRDYRRSNAVWNAMMKGASIGVAGALTSPPAQVGNILSSAMAAFTFHSQVDRRAALSIGALTISHMAKVSAKGAARLMERIGGLPVRAAYRRLAKNHPELAESIRNEYGKVYAAIGLNDADEVRRLGLSQTEGFFRTWQNAVKEAAQYATSEEQRRFSGATGSLSKAARIGTAAVLAPLKSTFKIIGLEATDLYANMQGLTSFRIIEKQWKDLAKTWGSDRVKQLGGSYDPSNPRWLVTADEYVIGISTGPAKENRLAQARLTANAVGTTLEDVLWSYYTRSEGGLKPASLFGEFEDSAKRYVIGQVNASIYTNRPQKAQSNPEQATLQILQGYASNMANQLAQAMRNVKSIPKMRRLLEDFGKVLLGFVVASIVGGLVGAARDIWARWMMGRLDRKMTPADPEFWKQDAGLTWRIAKQAFSMLPGGQTVVSIGDLSRGSTASGFFVFSLADRVLNYVRGVKDLPAEDLGWLANKARREMAPGSEPLVNHTTDNPSRKIMSATAAYSSAASQADLVKPGVFATGGPAPITAKSGILGRMNEAAMLATVRAQKGDTEGAAQATLEVSRQKDRLVDYHRKQITENNQRRGIEQSESEVDKDANANARRDWQDLNPISRALGHQPTESELAAINANLSGDRRKSADLGWAAYSSMAELFPDSKGRTTEPQQQRRETRRSGSSFGYSGAVRLGARRGGRSRGGRSRASSYGRSRSRSRRGARRVRR